VLPPPLYEDNSGFHNVHDKIGKSTWRKLLPTVGIPAALRGFEVNEDEMKREEMQVRGPQDKFA